ncbi:MAG: patatin-like phospholipase family protein [Candidatus Rokubacteria bacterium]|nr:patatin-like phospholipase family protein [Candidatus Rokubacteria bacterium]
MKIRRRSESQPGVTDRPKAPEPSPVETLNTSTLMKSAGTRPPGPPGLPLPLPPTDPLAELAPLVLLGRVIGWIWTLGWATVIGLILLLGLLGMVVASDQASAWVTAALVVAAALVLVGGSALHTMPALRVPLAIVGGALLAVLVGGLVLAVYWRTTGPGFLGAALSALGMVLLGALRLLLAERVTLFQWLPARLERGLAGLSRPPTPSPPPARDPARGGVLSGAGLVLGAILVAWLALSVAREVALPWTRRSLEPSAGELGAELERRRQLAGASDRVVAVTLSGGGYRAAATHAGVLWMLDEAGIPIHALSTVSGGSIVGAAYATGWAPERFKAHLSAARPGLADDLLDLFAMARRLAFPTSGSGDTYARHFDDVYFRGRTLAQTGPPTLIVNTTAYRDGARVAFWTEGVHDICDAVGIPSSRTAPAGPLALGRLVAASGAFPVAFEPVSIGGGRYVDGGLVDNLGVEGLREYLARATPARYPDLLIMSDLGAEPKPPAARYKPSALQMTAHGWDLSSRAIQEWIFRTYTGGQFRRDEPRRQVQPYVLERRRAWVQAPAGETRVFVLSPTSCAERCSLSAPEDVALVDKVASLDTLRELDSDEVEAAFWAGARLTWHHLPEICRAAGKPRCRESLAEPPRPAAAVSPPSVPAGASRCRPCS